MVKYGITANVEVDKIRSLASGHLAFHLMAKEGKPDHILAESPNKSLVLTALSHPLIEDGCEKVGTVVLRGRPLQVLRAFLDAHPGRIEVYMGPGVFDDDLRVSFTARDSGGYDRLTVWPSGRASLEVFWGSEDYWDRWFVDPTGEVEYTGTLVDEYRRPPTWLYDALK
jgi:hypothetical protein